MLRRLCRFLVKGQTAAAVAPPLKRTAHNFHARRKQTLVLRSERLMAADSLASKSLMVVGLGSN